MAILDNIRKKMTTPTKIENQFVLVNSTKNKMLYFVNKDKTTIDLIKMKTNSKIKITVIKSMDEIKKFHQSPFVTKFIDEDDVTNLNNRGFI